MKRIIFFLNLIMIISFTSCSNEKNNQNNSQDVEEVTNAKDNEISENKEVDGKFYSEKCKFKAKFPGKVEISPEQKTTEGFIIQSFAYNTDNNGLIVISEKISKDYKNIIEGTEEELSINIRNNTMKNMNATLIKEETIEYNGIPSNSYQAKGNFDGVDYYMKGMNIIRNEFIYLILAFDTDAEIAYKNFDNFMNSFEFVD